ncbi:MAG TPA: response regulator [Pyrinomonadaceae bacterium]
MLKRKLLLADDSITIQKVVNLTFADEGIEVISVGDGDSAMEKVRQYAPDLILADVNMPGLSGYQICEQIKQNAETQKIPVILLVGSFEPFDEAEAYRVGADDYLTKPFQSIRQLVTKVSDLLEAAETVETEAPAMEIADAANVHFFNTVEIAPEIQSEREPQFARARFGDAGMDDEMIQTSQVGSLPVDEIQKFIADSTAGISESAAGSGAYASDFNLYKNVEPEDDFGKTEPLDIEDLRTFSTENAEQSNGAAVYEIADSETDENRVVGQNDGGQFSNQETYRDTDQETRLSAETYGFNQGQTETESSADSADQMSPEPGAAFAPPFSEAPDFLFDDMDLLELPPVEPRAASWDNQSPDELQTEYQFENAGESIQQSSETEETAEFQSRTEFEQSAEAEKDAVNDATAQTEIDRQVAALSPELIEAIARRVAETMSDKAIREIAWEVVPQMTDLIVRRMAEEKLRE